MTVDKAALRDLSDTLNGILLPEGYNQQALKDAAVALPALLAEIDALRAELQARQWQPIETAPKDGGTVLLRGKHDHRIADGYWLQAAYNGNGAWVWPYIHSEPIHWMRLPPPPALQGDKQ